MGWFFYLDLILMMKKGYKGKLYYNRIHIVIWEYQSMWTLADILLTWFIMWLCYLLNSYNSEDLGD